MQAARVSMPEATDIVRPASADEAASAPTRRPERHPVLTVAPPAEPPTPAATPAPVRASTGIAAAVAAGALAGAVAALAAIVAWQHLPAPADTPTAAAIGEQLAQVSQAVDGLAGRVAPLETAGDTTAFRLAALGRRIDAIQEDLQRLGETGPDTLPAAIAVLQLKTRIDGGGPFRGELALVRQYVAETPETASALAVLLVGADRGVPTATDLRERFLRVAPLLLEQAGRADGTIIGWSMNRTQHALAFLGLTDEPPEDPLRAVVASARQALDRGQPAAAVAELETVDGIGGAIVSGWLSAARLRVATDQSIDLLLGRITRRMGQPK